MDSPIDVLQKDTVWLDEICLVIHTETLGGYDLSPDHLPVALDDEGCERLFLHVIRAIILLFSM
jgi:hypothetical protein